MKIEDLKIIKALLDKPLTFAGKKLTAEEDENGIVHLKDPETGWVYLSMLREDYEALLSYKLKEN